MTRGTKVLMGVVFFIMAAGLAASYPARVPLLSHLTGMNRPAGKMPTITSLPTFPGYPLYAPLFSRERQIELTHAIIDNKISTWPEVSSRSYRVGKFTSTGIFGWTDLTPTEAQIAWLAPNYDNILFGAGNKDLIARFKKYNPDLTFFIYVDSGLNPGFVQSDAGGVDDEGLDWILSKHPDWIMKDKDGNFIRSGGGLSNQGEYWPDPGNPGWQDYFAEKVTKLLRESGGAWDGVLLDQFIGTADGHVRYAQAEQQVNYPDDASYQAAYLEFLRVAAAKIQLPIIVNMEGQSIIKRPEFVREVALAAGGVENEVFPEEMPIEDLRPYLETVQNLPPDIHVRINSKPAGFAGDMDDTLFAYYCYLLIADRDRQIYWTNKEGSSDVPHYWYREFDLDLGASQGDIHFGQFIWSRSFEHSLVIVNPGKDAAEYSWAAADQFYDVNGNLLEPPLRLDGRSAMLLVRDLSILP